MATVVEGDQKAPFSIATTPKCRGGRYSFPSIRTLYCWVLSKEVSSAIFIIFGMTPGEQIQKRHIYLYIYLNPGRNIAFHIALIPLGDVWIQLFSLQLWVNSRTDCVLRPWLGNQFKKKTTLNSNLLNSA